jgi:hypothetical protein
MSKPPKQIWYAVMELQKSIHINYPLLVSTKVELDNGCVGAMWVFESEQAARDAGYQCELVAIAAEPLTETQP